MHPVTDASFSVGFVGSIGRACFSDCWLHALPGHDVSYRTGTRRALLAAVATGELDMAVYPGAAATAANTMLLCEDRLVVALGADDGLAALPAVTVAALRERPVILPGDGEEGDVRRLVQALAPGLGAVGEAPLAVVLQRLAATQALAIVAASQHDELRGRIVTRPIARVDTAFAVHLTWSARAAALGVGGLLAAKKGSISPPAPGSAMGTPGRRDDDASDGAGDIVLG